MVIARLEHSHAVNFAIPRRTAPRRATPTEVFLLSAGGTGPVDPVSGVGWSRIEETENSRGRGRLKGTKRKRRVLRPDGDISIFVSDARMLVSNREQSRESVGLWSAWLLLMVARDISVRVEFLRVQLMDARRRRANRHRLFRQRRPPVVNHFSQEPSRAGGPVAVDSRECSHTAQKRD